MRACRPGFFLPVRVLSRLFRGKFIGAPGSVPELTTRPPRPLPESSAFGRYLHEASEVGGLCRPETPLHPPHLPTIGYFTWMTRSSATDYRSRRSRSLTLPLAEFTRRFLLHVLPRGLVRIRYYVPGQRLPRSTALVLPSRSRPAQAGRAKVRAKPRQRTLLMPSDLRLCPICPMRGTDHSDVPQPDPLASLKRPAPVRACGALGHAPSFSQRSPMAFAFCSLPSGRAISAVPTASTPGLLNPHSPTHRVAAQPN